MPQDKRSIIVLLGKTGDLVSILSLAKWQHDQGNRWTILASEKYIGVLDGCSYVDPIPFAGDYWALEEAVKQAKKLSDDVRVAQVIGPPDAVKRLAYEPQGLKQATTDSFVKESWKLLGHLDKWKDGLPVVFDQRDKERESALLPLLDAKKKTILVALGGVTSVFPFKDLLLEMLRLKFKKGWAIVDVSKVRSERIYDLLALYEKAYCLVSDDSASLHLARACPRLPVVALVNDRPSLWHGSPWSASHVCHIRYNDFPHRAVELLRAIDGIGEPGCPFYSGIKTPKIIHVWSDYEVNDESRVRHESAKASWALEYLSDRWVKCPVEVGALGQDSGTTLKDDRRYPLVKDVIRVAALRASEDDIICLTRCDTCFTDDLNQQLVKGKMPAYAYRTLRDGTQDTFHPAADLFAFTKSWWNARAKEYPNLVLGMDTYWHRVLLDLIKQDGGTELPFAIYRAHSEPPKAAPKATRRLAYNEQLATQFWKERPSQLEPLLLIDQSSDGWEVNRHALHPYGYNPSLIQFGQRLLMAYRWHPDHETQTKLAMAELDPQFNVLANKEIQVHGRSIEDPRLFIQDEELWCCFVDSTWPEINPKCVVKIGRLREQDKHWSLDRIEQPQYGHNDGNSMEKNWVYFQHEGSLFCIYSCSPHHVIYDGPSAITTTGPQWPWGAIRGGTSPIPYKDKWLRFFHSGLDTEPAPWRRRYYVGALLMEPKPPFNVITVSKQPILRGTERDTLSELERSGCTQYKARVVFPAGCIQVDDGFLISVGINDSASAIIKVSENELNL